MADPVWFPPNESRLVKAARFVNVLDDAHNILSPVKINVWGANLAAFSTIAAGIVGWIGGHLSHVNEIGTLVGGWLGQAHMMHHADKRERNLQAARMKDDQ